MASQGGGSIQSAFSALLSDNATLHDCLQPRLLTHATDAVRCDTSSDTTCQRLSVRHRRHELNITVCDSECVRVQAVYSEVKSAAGQSVIGWEEITLEIQLMH